MARIPHANADDEDYFQKTSRASEVNSTMPDFDAPVTGRNNESNNWEDQRNQRNKERNYMDLDAVRKHRK